MTSVEVEAADDEQITLECVRTLFRQIPNSFAAAIVVTVYMVATAAPFIPRTTIAAWLALQIATQGGRVWIMTAYRRLGPAPDAASLRNAARRFSAFMLAAGLVWGCTAFLFMDPARPLTIALTMCGLYGVSAGSVPGNAYNPLGLYAFIGGIFGAVMARMLLIGDYGYIVLGLASLCYAGILALFTRVQNRAVREGFAIRFENRRLLAALEREKLEAEAARARAEQANLAKSQLLAAASHDLRQPLHALSLFSGSLESLALDAAAKDVAHRIQANVGAMETLFNGLLDMSRLEAGVVRCDPAPVRLQDLFDRLAAYFDPLAEREGVRLRFRDTGLWVLADATLLEQICANLLANAVKYAPGGGVLVAARRRPGALVSIEVHDTGVGIAPADQGRIFEDFVQLGNPERDRGKGLGLGLAIAQRLSGLMGTRVQLRSASGRGSRFHLELPRCEATPLSPRPGAGSDLVDGLRVLLIDDDDEVRDGAERLLRRWGVLASVVADVAAAEAAIAGGPPFDVCISDYRLTGELDGLQAIDRLSRGPVPPRAFCLLTGDMSPDLFARSGAAGVPIIHKPLQPARLRALLNTLAAQEPPG